MREKLTETESTLLHLIAAETQRVKKLRKTRALNDDPHEWAARSIAISDLPLIGVRVSGDWIGSSDADRKARQRGLRSLEDRKLIDLTAVHGRAVTHAKLTKAGKELAEALSKPEAEG